MSKGMYYNRQGEPIGLFDWSKLLESGEPYCRVAITALPGTDGYVSTVWIGLNHDFTRKGPPLIFETMIRCPGLDEFTLRAATEEEAKLNHQAAVEKALVDLGMMDD